MDMSWVTGRIAVGGGIWTAENMAQVARAEVTHIIDMQIEFDDTALALPIGRAGRSSSGRTSPSRSAS